MTTRKFEKILTDIIGGSEALSSLQSKATEGMIPRAQIRQIFSTKAREFIAETAFTNLGELCALTKNFSGGSTEYEALTITTSGTNSWSGIFLSTSDSGQTLLEKIATASILEGIIELILGKGATNHFEQTWLNVELVTLEEIKSWQRREEVLSKKLGW